MKLFAPTAIALGVALMGAGPAVAQFGNPFEPPRPPGNVPVRPQPQRPQPQSQAPPNPLTPGPSLGRPGAIQSQDLPPPTGTQPAALPQPDGATPPSQTLPPGQRQPRAGLPPLNAPATAAPAPPPAEEAVSAPPRQRISNPTVVFSGLDKITGRITAFDAAIGETVQFGALQ